MQAGCDARHRAQVQLQRRHDDCASAGRPYLQGAQPSFVQPAPAPPMHGRHALKPALTLNPEPSLVRSTPTRGACKLQEEITHCAAGVRWFTHLHELAQSGQPPAAARQPCSGGLRKKSGSSSEAGGHGAADPRSSSSGGADPPLPSWVLEARQHPAVETWFHQQVRTHFRGPLKVRSRPCSRNRKRFAPSSYHLRLFVAWAAHCLGM